MRDCGIPSFFMAVAADAQRFTELLPAYRRNPELFTRQRQQDTVGQKHGKIGIASIGETTDDDEEVRVYGRRAVRRHASTGHRRCLAAGRWLAGRQRRRAPPRSGR